MERTVYSLFELNTLIKSLITQSFPVGVWVTAEIAELKCNQKGHCYLELVEKAGDRSIAQSRATIWSYDYRNLSRTFEKATGESLKAGMKVLFLVSVNFHELYGLSFTIRDVDPAYTLGEMALRKKEVIERLTEEGIIGLNKALPLPLVPQRVAVISSPTAAGYGDFFNQLDLNPYGYKFIHVLFPAVMQGQEAESSIISALKQIHGSKSSFDVVAIIRGGGSAVDLSCFDCYPLASFAAKFPLPVITGIGHEKDDSVMDIVAHTRLKTPTAVAEFLISGLRSFEENVEEIRDRVLAYTQRFMTDAGYRLDDLGRRLTFVPARTLDAQRHKLLMLEKDLGISAKQMIRKESERFRAMEQAVRHLDPANVLRRGYSITRYKGRVLKDASSLKKWAVIETRLHSGAVTSIVHEKKEVEKDGKKQAGDLLPGFE
jgi:exodeoxyribonuclease VII large subunit